MLEGTEKTGATGRFQEPVSHLRPPIKHRVVCRVGPGQHVNVVTCSACSKLEADGASAALWLPAGKSCPVAPNCLALNLRTHFITCRREVLRCLFQGEGRTMGFWFLGEGQEGLPTRGEAMYKRG